MNGWTLERRQRQAIAIRQWQPWAKSTGPRSAEGKLVVSRNAWKGGHQQQLRELTRMLNEEIRLAQELVQRVRA